MKPKQPTNESYMRGWFLVRYHGDTKRARAEAKEYVEKEVRNGKA